MWFHFFHRWQTLKRDFGRNCLSNAKMQRCDICGKYRYTINRGTNYSYVATKQEYNIFVDGCVNDHIILTNGVHKFCENLKEKMQKELHKQIEFRAYLIAEQDGFSKDPKEYWRIAENLINEGIKLPEAKNERTS